MIQKKICMVGVFATGKTCLVQRYVHSIFSPRYLSTVGVKIDRKEVPVHGDPVMLMLWDLEGRDGMRDVNPSYVRGAHGLIFQTCEIGQPAGHLRQFVEKRTILIRAGQKPFYRAVNYAWVDTSSPFVIQSEAAQCTGREVVEHDI